MEDLGSPTLRVISFAVKLLVAHRLRPEIKLATVRDNFRNFYVKLVA